MWWRPRGRQVDRDQAVSLPEQRRDTSPVREVAAQPVHQHHRRPLPAEVPQATPPLVGHRSVRHNVLQVRLLLFRGDLRVVIGLAQHAGECLQQRPRHGRVALHKRLEVPQRDSLADEFAVSGHRG